MFCYIKSCRPYKNWLIILNIPKHPIWRYITLHKARVAVRLTIVGVVAGLGVVLLSQTSAVSFVISSEAESGLLAGPATRQNVSGASGGSSVRFAASPTVPTPPPSPPPAGGRVVPVDTSAELTSAIANAKPGDTIQLANGSYTGKLAVGNYSGAFSVTKSGTAATPITLTGSRSAVIDAGGTSSRYGLYIADASHWNIVGITITNATKGVVMDRSNHISLDNVWVYNVGEEAVHFRSFSSDNILKNSLIEQTGIKKPQYGEGVYIGSAKSNWGTHSGGNPDTSDRNQVLTNTIRNTGAENIDIKEGSSYGTITGNSFDGIGIKGENYADSWIDVKGNNYTISNNTGVVSGPAVFLDGFQVHRALSGWGNDNVFRDNNLNLNNAAGYGFLLQSGVTGNVLSCSNTVSNAGGGFAAIGSKATACTSP